MAERSFQELLSQGIMAIDQGNTMMALMHLEDATKLGASLLPCMEIAAN